jgi:hypothetical protein
MNVTETQMCDGATHPTLKEKTQAQLCPSEQF